MFSTGVGDGHPCYRTGAGLCSPVLSHRCGVVFTRVIAPVRCCVHPCYRTGAGLWSTVLWPGANNHLWCLWSNSHKFHQSFWFLEVRVGEFSDVPRISQKPQKAHPQTQMSLSTKNDDFLTNRFRVIGRTDIQTLNHEL